MFKVRKNPTEKIPPGWPHPAPPHPPPLQLKTLLEVEQAGRVNLAVKLDDALARALAAEATVTR